MYDFRSVLKDVRRNWLIAAFLSIALGLVLLLFPGITAKAVCYLLGGLSILFGVSRILRHFQHDSDYAVFFQGDLTLGLFCVVIGLFMILRAEAVISLIPIFFGIVLLASGITGIQRAVDSKRNGCCYSWALVLMPLLTLAAGVVLLVNPFASLQVAIIVIGATLIYEGVTDMLSILLISKKIGQWKRNA